MTFEVGVLLAAFATMGAFFFRSRLWPGKRAAVAAAGTTDARLVIVLKAENAGFDRKAAERIAGRHDVALAIEGND